MDEKRQILGRLRTMKLEELRDEWRKQMGSDPPAITSREVFRWELAWRLQAKVYGDLSTRTRRRLRDLVDTDGNAASPAPVPKLRSGASLVRDWNGKKHEVLVTDGGYVYRGTMYKSLSAIAREITGTRWSGPAFFGLKKRSEAA